MPFELHFISANIILTKEFSLDSNDHLSKSSYPMVKNVSSYIEYVSTVEEFAEAINKHSKLGHCLVKGKLDRTLSNESRAGHTDPNQPTDWTMLDIDGLPYTPEKFMEIIGYENVTYLVQYSASTGVIRTQDSGLFEIPKDRYHIFILLSEPQTPEHIKEWLRNLNFNVPQIKKHLTLSSSKDCLSYPLDITVC